jgi:hypothetical protein
VTRIVDSMASPILFHAVPSIRAPGHEDIEIWRYMDFAKFVALLESRALFFTRVASFHDPFEGSYPARQDASKRASIMNEHVHRFVPSDKPVSEVSAGILESLAQHVRQWSLACCWHASQHESMAMWKVYAPAAQVVAIRSTVGRLRSSFDPSARRGRRR